MSIHQDLELKKAILNLSTKDKDKLLLRLINKDKMLVKQLHFQLLEDEYDLKDRIETLRVKLTNLMQPKVSKIKNLSMYSHFKALTSLLREASGLINEHEKVTKDKFSEVEFRFLILIEAFKNYPVLFIESPILVSEKLRKYTASKIKSVNGKYNKLHEDLQFDLGEDYEFIALFAEDYKLV